MTEKRFKITDDGIVDTVRLEQYTKIKSSDNVFDSISVTHLIDVVNLLNELSEENEHYKSIFFELVETALTDKNCRELYCKGILDIFDKANSLNQSREMIKEYLK